MSVFALAWLIPFFLLLACVVIAAFAHRSRAATLQVAINSIAFSFLLAQILFWARLSGDERFFSAATRWFTVGQSVFRIGLHIDAVGALMLFVAPLVGLLGFIYAADAFQGDTRYNRFFAYLSLLIGGILGLIIVDNLLAFSVCWAVVDVCVYLLTGLGYEHGPAREAALWAFLVNGLGTLCLALGLALLCTYIGSPAYDDVFDRAALERLAQATLPGISFPLLSVVALLLLGSVVARSAQFPLHVWPVKATEAAAPTSMFIHALVAPLGVFLLARAYPLFEAAMSALTLGSGVNVVTLLGIVTAVVTALFALAQRDVRRALSLSIVGQLGYAVTALGLGAFAAGVLHLMVTVVVAALLFLAAGAITHGMTSVQQAELGHAPLDPHDMLQMGGLRGRQKDTFMIFLIGALTLGGLPFVTAGFWSRDAVLTWASNVSQTAFWLLVVSLTLTGFSAMRQVCLIFVGPPRSPAAAQARESPPTMTAPMVVLAFLALALGILGIPPQLVGLGGVIPGGIELLLDMPDPARDFVWEITSLGITFSMSGLLLAFLVYAWQPLAPGQGDRLERLGFLYRWLRDGPYLDRLYRWAFGAGTVALAGTLAGMERALGRLADGIRWLGRGLSLAGAWFEANVLHPPVGWIARVGQALGYLCAWADVCILDAPVRAISRVGRSLAQISHTLECQVLGRLTGGVAAIGKGLACACAALDPWLDRLVHVARPGTLALVQLSSWIERGIDSVVDHVGSAVKAGGLLFRVPTGKVQSYLLLASIAILVLTLIFLIL